MVISLFAFTCSLVPALYNADGASRSLPPTSNAWRKDPSLRYEIRETRMQFSRERREYRSMRLLIWHVDGFAAEPSERGRSKIADDEPRAVVIAEGLVVFAATERTDE